MASKKTTSLFQEWGKKIDWKKRVKAVCKPCWEIKYCPYGPLIEEFPLKSERDSQSCRIFGHDCPVFYVAEPLTETKELRNISRHIPRPVQFRVLKRENQICNVCGKNVQDDEIHFDHIIPHSKGGSSDENNIRLLCDQCNINRSNRYEAEHLVTSVEEHLQPTLDLSFLELLLHAFGFAHDFRKKEERFPNAAELCTVFNEGEKPSIFEEGIAETFTDFEKLFLGEKPEEMTKRHHQALAMRWGYTDGVLYHLAEVCDKFRLEIADLVIMERTLLSRAGWYINETKMTRKKWIQY